MIPFRTPYGPRAPLALNCADPSRTKQSMKKDCDINFIVGQYRKTGLIAHVQQRQGYYGDIENIDFHEAMNQVRLAEEMFLSVPATIRKQFGNDMGEFLTFVQDPANADKMVELGLAEKRPKGETPPPKWGGAALRRLSTVVTGYPTR